MIYDDLLWRNMIKDVSNEELARKLLEERKFSFYTGFDPTGESLTVGHLVQIIRIRYMLDLGFKPYVLIGGATGLIGDPREVGERKLLDEQTALSNANMIKKQLSQFLDPCRCVFVNNYDWIKKIDTISFLRDYGKAFNINYMLAKDVVNRRLDSGISFTEFSYMILQALDFLHLYQKHGVKVQFGGSDQWGNITAGLDLIKKESGADNDCLGISSPLLLKSDGKKFGKSENGALFLNPSLTSPYEMYQYFLNTDDKDTLLYLKVLTLLPRQTIEEVITKHSEAPEKRLAQKKIASEVCKFIYGEAGLKEAENITNALFNTNISNLSNGELEQLYKASERIEIKKDSNIVEALVVSKLAQSNREAREFISNNAISINDNIINDQNYTLGALSALYKKYFVIRRGKKKYQIVKISE